MITPFKEDKIDEEGLRLLIDRQRAAGVSAIVVLGTTGEALTLSEQERDQVVRLACDAARPLPVIVGTGSPSTKQTIAQTLRAQELGAQGALIIAPYYNKPSSEGLFAHYKAVSESVSIPLIVYNSPSRTGVNILPPLLERLSGLPHVIGVKECCGQLDQISDLLAFQRERNPSFTVWTGDDSYFYTMLTLGGHGIISVTANLYPQTLVALYRAFQNGNYAEAREIHFRLLPLFRALFAETNPMAVKEALQLMDLAAGPCRLPLCQLQPATRQLLIQAMREECLV
jgi:4-hydroxy-tetrahydrodipicolinate synthase